MGKLKHRFNLNILQLIINYLHATDAEEYGEHPHKPWWHEVEKEQQKNRGCYYKKHSTSDTYIKDLLLWIIFSGSSTTKFLKKTTISSIATNGEHQTKTWKMF